MSETKLLKCPMCNGKAELDVVRHGDKQYDFARVYCIKCGLEIRKDIDVEYSAKDECIKTWNNRKADGGTDA